MILTAIDLRGNPRSLVTASRFYRSALLEFCVLSIPNSSHPGAMQRRSLAQEVG